MGALGRLGLGRHRCLRSTSGAIMVYTLESMCSNAAAALLGSMHFLGSIYYHSFCATSINCCTSPKYPNLLDNKEGLGSLNPTSLRITKKDPSRK